MRRRPRGERRRVLAFGALPAILGAAVLMLILLPGGATHSQAAKADPGPSPQDVLAHFACYRALPFGPTTPRPVTLTDQFGTANAVVSEPLVLCNPTKKARPGIGTTPIPPGLESAHLVCYLIDDTLTPPTDTIKTSNQFGSEQLTVNPAQNLCLPSLKNPVPGGPSVADIEKVLAHFKCYGLTELTPFTPVDVVLSDQFGVQPVQAVKPFLLCNPTAKTVTDAAGNTVTHPIPPGLDFAHLKCYATQPITPMNETVTVQNQFGTQDLLVVGLNYLCVPSLKIVPPPELSHFKCYNAKAQFAGATVFLSDQFEATEAELKEPELFCNPVEKRFAGTVTPITNREAHLKCYPLKEKPKFDGADVEVRNQFGVQRLTVRKALSLCAPASKSETPAVPPGEPPSNISHFKCYDVKPVKTPKRAVVLVDQFDTEDAVVDGPSRLCTPVEKRTSSGQVFPIVSPPSGINHLVCYDIKTAKLTSRTVLARTQFGLEVVKVDGARLLCLPSTKRVL